MKPHPSPWFSAAFVAVIVCRNHVFHLYQQLIFLKLPNLHMLLKQKIPSLLRNFALRISLWEIANGVLNKVKSAIPCLFCTLEMLSFASDKAKLFVENSNLDASGISLPVFPSRTNLKLNNISVTLKMIKKVGMNLNSLKVSCLDYIPVVVSNKWKPELSYILTELFRTCLKESCFPYCWKISVVVPLFKNVGERSTAKKYHPVSLLPMVGKSL